MTEQLEKILNDLPYSIRHSGEIEELKEFAREQAQRAEELEKKVKRYEQKFDEILELGWTENFGGSYVNMGEYHAEAIQIAESAVGRSKRK